MLNALDIYSSDVHIELSCRFWQIDKMNVIVTSKQTIAIVKNYLKSIAEIDSEAIYGQYHRSSFLEIKKFK